MRMLKSRESERALALLNPHLHHHREREREREESGERQSLFIHELHLEKRGERERKLPECYTQALSIDLHIISVVSLGGVTIKAKCIFNTFSFRSFVHRHGQESLVAPREKKANWRIFVSLHK